MSKLVRLVQIACVASLVVGLSLLVGGLGGSRSSALQATPTFEPTPIDTPTPQPGFVMVPDQGLAGDRIKIEGYGWTANSAVDLTWDGDDLPTTPLNLSTDGGGHFLGHFDVPAGAPLGTHVVRVTVAGTWAEEPFYVVAATPTWTSTPGPTFTFTPTSPPAGPTYTPSPTLSPTPAPTFRQVTPIVSATATRVSPPSTPRPTSTRAPTQPPTLVPTGSPTPSPTPTATPVPPMATNTSVPVATATVVALVTQTPTPTPTWTPAATQSPTPTGTSEGTAAPSPTPTPSGGLTQTGIGLGLLVAAAVLGATVFVVRILRTRGFRGES